MKKDDRALLVYLRINLQCQQSKFTHIAQVELNKIYF